MARQTRTQVDSERRFERRTVLKLGLGVGLLTLARVPAIGAPPPANEARLEADLRAWLEGIVERGWVSGAAIDVLRPNVPHLHVIAGDADREADKPLTLDTVYRIYSMTKPVTASAMMVLVERGIVELDQPIADFLPEFESPRVFVRFEGEEVVTESARRPITIRHLLTHTSGLSESFNKGIEPTALIYEREGLLAGQWYRTTDIRTLEELVKRIARIPLASHPGEKWNYGSSLDVAGRVIEVASGEGFASFMHTSLIEPLDMIDTAFVAPANRNRLASVYRAAPDSESVRVPEDEVPGYGEDPVVPMGGAGLYSTLPDYARFVQMLINKGELDGVRVLSEDSVMQMMTNQLGKRLGNQPLSTAARFGLGGEVNGLGFGLGGSVLVDPGEAGGYGTKGEYAWGGAASTTFWVDPANRLGAVLMTQKLPSGIHPLRDQFRRIVYRHVA